MSSPSTATSCDAIEANLFDAGQLQQLSLLTGAAGGASWMIDSSSGQLRLESQWGLGEPRLDRVQQSWPGHSELLLQVAQAGQTQTVDAQIVINGATQTLKLCLVRPTPHRVLELFFAADRAIDAGAIQHAYQLLRTSRADDELAPLLLRLQSSLNPDVVARTLVNDVRLWTAFDRVALVRQRDGQHVVASISGTASFDPRSAAVLQLQELSRQVAAQGVVADVLTPENSPIVRSYAEANEAIDVLLWPVGNESILVLERFGKTAAGLPTRPRADVALVTSAAAQALSHADSCARLALHPVLRWLQPCWSSGTRRAALVLLTGAVVVGLLTWVQTDLVVHAPGTLRPLTTRDVYAPVSAIVDRVHVQHGATVVPETLLMTLRSPSLDLEHQKIRGELRTVDQQIADLETLRSDPARARGPDSAFLPGAELAARELEFKVLREALLQQLELLDQQQSTLQLSSPITGTVLTWEVQQTWRGRPVDQGQKLISVADLQGPWVLEVLVPQADLAAIDRVLEPVVQFQTSQSQPIVQGRIIAKASEMQLDVSRGLVLAVQVEIPQGCVSAVSRPGTLVATEIHCGRASVGYVWFRRAVDQVVGWWALRWGQTQTNRVE